MINHAEAVEILMKREDHEEKMECLLVGIAVTYITFAQSIGWLCAN